ncbi:HAX1 protein, partial [Corythaixoides concolor]|nr:HAX1 protein [Corythaixoides concolor]
MSFFEAFRGFFGFQGRCRPRDPLFGGTAWDDEEEEEEDGGPSLAQPPPDFFGFSLGGPRSAFEELFRDMGELLGIFGGAWARPPQPFEPALPGTAEGSAEWPLRDSMLKHPDSPAPGASPGSLDGASD